MLQQRLIELQSVRGAKSSSTETVKKSIDWAINDCRKYIQSHSKAYRNVDGEQKKSRIKNLIIEYVMNNGFLVEGFTDEEDRLDTNKLINRLIEDITDYGIITLAMNDPTVYEVRCNGKELKVEKGGRIRDLTDPDGNIISFESTEQQDIIMRKLLGDVRLTPKDALVNSRTIEGYRIAAVHSSATSPDPNAPGESPYHSFVLRKFNKIKMRLADTVKKGTLSDDMARFLKIVPSGGLVFVTVGATGSGKTTTNNAILQEVPPDLRVVLIQNPSEIDLRFKDSSGRVFNDVIHLEAKDIDNPSPNDPTMSNMMDHTLRLSPTLVCMGESRTGDEFKLCMKILQAGHPINTTFHAESPKGALQRFLSAYLSVANEPSHLALESLTSLVNLIVVQKVLKDGTRKIICISEILGVDPADINKPIINDLYTFEPVGDPEFDNTGRISKINGEHKRVGKLSDKCAKKLQLEGIKRSQYSFMLEELELGKIEEYTGENIDGYGLDG